LRKDIEKDREMGKEREMIGKEGEKDRGVKNNKWEEGKR